MGIENKIPVIRTEEGNQAVNARDLHDWLNVGRDFTSWIKGRIGKYGFEESKDFQIIRLDMMGNVLTDRLPRIGENLAETGESDNQRVAKTEYIISLDMAKELSMVENNERGREARKYFIEVEKLARKACEVHGREMTNDRIERERMKIMLGAEWIEKCSSIISMNEVSKLQLLGKVKEEAGELGRFLPLPEYAKTDGVSKSATELLRIHRPNLGVQEFNKILVKNGVLLDLERKSTSSSNGKKRYKAIAKDWLYYGENLANPHSPNNRQPMWFIDKFEELLKKLGI